MNNSHAVVTFSKGILCNKNIKIFLGVDKVSFKTSNDQSDLVVGWGRKKNTYQAINFAKELSLQYSALEDGFIHSMGQGVLGNSSCSLVKDNEGIYYDATQSSDLENLIIESDAHYYEDSLIRAEGAISRITVNNITKYNNGSLVFDELLFESDDIILVVDQTAGDMSLKYGYVDKQTFKDMLQAAISENPHAKIIVKTHPDVIAGKKTGGLDLSDVADNISIISENINPILLLKHVTKVYVATSQLGFEALMLKKTVVCFGVPFYAGWGLTDDRADKSLAVWGRRHKKRSLNTVFAAAYIKYTKYIHPDHLQLCSLENILDYFELQYKNHIDKPLYCINFTRWKRQYISSFLKTSHKLVFVSSALEAVKKGFGSQSQLVAWSSKGRLEVNKLMDEFNITSWQIEDGFIRSTGLGTDLTAPASLVLDKTGIYYDPSSSSDLEQILQNKAFSKEELVRAEKLRASLLKNELSKYNLGVSFDQGVMTATKNQTIILIPGQVEDDASIKKGCVDVSSNTDLIKAVRNKEPDAYLIYKPHPDVVSGNRKGSVDNDTLKKYTDLVLLDASITDCLAIVDEVHTMTSLVGFEGLLRELKVVCYGLPFYSNWGLTEDLHVLARRSRQLKLDELVAGTLIDYPLYINWETGDFTTPEVIVNQLKQKIDQQGGKQSNQIFWLQRQLRKLKNIFNGIVFHRR